MAIRDRFRRSARKSGSSDEHPLPDAAGAPTTLISTGASSLSSSPSSSTTPSTTDLTKTATISSSASASSSSSSGPSSRRVRLPWGRERLPWGRERRDRKKKSLDSCYGPWDKPFTETNLRHQEMFSTFTMTFGRQRRGSSGAWSYESGVSPLTSRQCSVVDLSAEPPVELA